MFKVKDKIKIHNIVHLVNFDRFDSFYYENIDEFKTSKPIIIFNTRKSIWFLKMVDERIFKKRPNFYFEINNVKFDYEYSVNQHYCVDTSMVYVMDPPDFFKYFNIKNVNDFNTNHILNVLNNKDAIEILFQTGWLSSQKWPQVIYNELEIRKDNENQLNNHPLYINHRLIEDDHPYDDETILELKDKMRHLQNNPINHQSLQQLGLSLKKYTDDLQTKIELGIDIKPTFKSKKKEE